MQRVARIQAVGPVVLFCALLAAEAAAYALAQMPSSGFLWYLNLEVFSIFRKSRAALWELGNLPFAQVLLIAGPMALIGLLGLSLKNNLYVAISSNLSFCFAAFLAYNWHAWTSATHVQGGIVDFRTGSFRRHPVDRRGHGGYFVSVFRGIPLPLFRRTALRGMTGGRHRLLFRSGDHSSAAVLHRHDGSARIQDPQRLILVVAGLFFVHALLSGRWVEMHWNIGLAALAFAFMLYWYSQGLMGGGDLKLMTVALLWSGIRCALPFLIILVIVALCTRSRPS